MNKDKIKEAIENVRLFHNGELKLKYNLDTINIKNGIDWNYQHSTSHSTYQVYLHSLSILKDFVTVIEHKNREKESQFALSFLMNWLVNGKDTEFAWHEHAVASRIINIVEFQKSTVTSKLDQDLFQHLLNKHCAFLNDEKNYKHNNHGLMMDNALIYASYYINDASQRDAYLDKALYRIRTSMYRDLTRQGLHIENSPEYHNLYIALLNRIFKTLEKYEIKLEDDLHNLKKFAIKVRADLLKPNNEFPLIGDTGQTRYSNIDKTFDNIIDFDAGLIVLQNENIKSKILSKYFTFTCGFISKTHKHHDDLSITYYNNGHDILIDPGKYAYSKNDDRAFITSPQSHTSVAIKNKNYPLVKNVERIKSDLKITKYFYNEDYHFLEGINNLYENVQIKRTCIVTKKNDLIIIDTIIQEEIEPVLQTFNLNENAEILQTPSHFEITIDNNVYMLETFGTSENVTSKIVDGFISKKFGQKIDNKLVRFEKESKHVEFTTILKEKQSTTEILNKSNTLVSIHLDNKKVDIKL